MNGGYSMVDCTGLDLGNPGTINGLYAQVKNAVKSNKPIYLYNLVNGEQALTPIAVYGGLESSTSVFLSFSTTTLHISNADVVTI